jgi:hypothetical protein
MDNSGRDNKYNAAGTTGRVDSSLECVRKVARIQGTGVVRCLRAGRVQQLDLDLQVELALALAQQIPVGPAPDRRLLVSGAPISMLA